MWKISCRIQKTGDQQLIESDFCSAIAGICSYKAGNSDTLRATLRLLWRALHRVYINLTMDFSAHLADAQPGMVQRSEGHAEMASILHPYGVRDVPGKDHAIVL